jgi:diguanylate cyclase (GGDEF)-like protein
VFVDARTGDPLLREVFVTRGFLATLLVPLATPGQFLGLLSVSVTDAPERLRPQPDLLDRLSGIAAQATTALQNGRLVDQITHQALHDQLTGLPNRSQFAAELRGAVTGARRRSERVTLFYIDLDGFKPVNDEHGHDTGDELLIAVGARLGHCTRAGDTVARQGGDEFAVLVGSDGRPDDADALAERLADAFRRPFVIGGHELYLGASVGRAAFPEDASTADDLLHLADAAMFDVKRTHQAQLATRSR